MPEETNRVLTDHCSDILFCPTETAVNNLKKEGFSNIINNGKLISSTQLRRYIFSRPGQSPNNLITQPPMHKFPRPLREKVSVRGQLPLVMNVGDIMYDTLLMCLPIAEKKSKILQKLKLKPKEYYLATVHRAENTDDIDRLRNILKALIEISKYKPVVFPIHPRTRHVISENCLLPTTCYLLKLTDPVSYLDMLILEKNALKILTDSGGVQKEAYLLKVPCITLRNETEWGETIENGWNIVLNCDLMHKLTSCILNYLKGNKPALTCKPFLGYGEASSSIVYILELYAQS